MTSGSSGKIDEAKAKEHMNMQLKFNKDLREALETVAEKYKESPHPHGLSSVNTILAFLHLDPQVSTMLLDNLDDHNAGLLRALRSDTD